jgi:hypothetical protein
MARSQQWSVEPTELRQAAGLSRIPPSEVWAEREAACRAELTPNMAVLGDPLPGRSALDAKRRTLTYHSVPASDRLFALVGRA